MDFSHSLFQKPLVLIKASSETSFRIVETLLQGREDLELRWHSDTIEALADIFFSKPKLLIVFEDSNTEGIQFLELVRNNAQFREMSAFLILPEPLKFKHKLKKPLNVTERFTTPLNHGLFFESLTKALGS